MQKFIKRALPHFFALLLSLLLSLGVFASTADGFKRFRFEGYGFEVGLPQNWIIFTQDIEDDDPNLELAGVTGSEMRELFESEGLLLNAVSPDQFYELTVSLAQGRHISDIFSYSLSTQEELMAQAQGVLDFDYSQLSPGLRYETYEIEKSGDLTYLKLQGTYQSEGDDTPLHFIQYNTVFNGYSINISYYEKDEQVSQEGMALAEATAKTLVFDKTLRKPISTTIYLLFVLLAAIVLTLIVKIARERRKAKKR